MLARFEPAYNHAVGTETFVTLSFTRRPIRLRLDVYSSPHAQRGIGFRDIAGEVTDVVAETVVLDDDGNAARVDQKRLCWFTPARLGLESTHSGRAKALALCR